MKGAEKWPTVKEFNNANQLNNSVNTSVNAKEFTNQQIQQVNIRKDIHVGNCERQGMERNVE